VEVSGLVQEEIPRPWESAPLRKGEIRAVAWTWFVGLKKTPPVNNNKPKVSNGPDEKFK